MDFKLMATKKGIKVTVYQDTGRGWFKSEIHYYKDMKGVEAFAAFKVKQFNEYHSI